MVSKEEINALKNRINVLEKRIELLEQDKLAIKGQRKMDTNIVEQPQTVKGVVDTEKPEKITQPKIDFEKQIGQVWLPRIFIFVLLLGVVWAFKAASNNGILTEPIRVVLGFLFSIVLYWLGERQIKHGRKALGLVLLGGMVTLLVLTTFAANNLYGFFGGTIAFILNTLWIILGIGLSQKHHSEALSIFVGIGGYLVPFLIESTNPNPIVFAGYELLLYISLLLLAVKRQFIILYYISLFLLHIVYLIYNLFTNGDNDQILILGVFIQQIVLLIHFIWKNGTFRFFCISMFGNAVFMITWIYMIYDTYADWFIFGLFLLYGIIAIYFKGKSNLEKFVVSSTITSYSLFIFLYHFLESGILAGLILVEGMIVIYLGLFFKSHFKQISGFILFIIGMGLTFEQGIIVFLSTSTLNWLLLILTISIIYVLYKKYDGAYAKDLKKLILTGSITALLLIILVFVTQVTYVLTEIYSFNVTQMSISFVWAIYGVFAIFFGINKRSKWIRLFGIGMLFTTLLKLIFVDLPTVSIIIRAILFIGVGIIGVAISRLYYSKKE